MSASPKEGTVPRALGQLAASDLAELMAIAERRDRTKFRNQILKPLLEAGWQLGERATDQPREPGALES